LKVKTSEDLNKILTESIKAFTQPLKSKNDLKNNFLLSTADPDFDSKILEKDDSKNIGEWVGKPFKT
jgi:hypothetical protein